MKYSTRTGREPIAIDIEIEQTRLSEVVGTSNQIASLGGGFVSAPALALLNFERNKIESLPVELAQYGTMTQRRNVSLLCFGWAVVIVFCFVLML
jgi:hypothetical protein